MIDENFEQYLYKDAGVNAGSDADMPSGTAFDIDFDIKKVISDNEANSIIKLVKEHPTYLGTDRPTIPTTKQHP